MRENTDHENSRYGHFSRSVYSKEINQLRARSLAVRDLRSESKGPRFQLVPVGPLQQWL